MNKKGILVVLVLLLIGGGVVGAVVLNNRSKTTDSTHNTSQPPTNNQEEETSPAVETDEVEIENFAFTPRNIKVKKGTTVTWTNKDTAKHTVTPDTPSAAFKASELLGRDESYSHTFDAVGTYKYHCEPHPYMEGVVEVVE